MPTTGAPQGQEPNPTTDPAPSTSTDPASTPDPAPAGGAPKDPWEGIPDEWAWTKEKVESANREAASRRVALRDLEDKLKDAKTPEEFEAAKQEFNKKESELTKQLARESAARKHKLSDELMEFLNGTTAEQIEAQAAKLAALNPGTPPTPHVVTAQPPAGGVTPQAPAPELSGKAAWRAYKDRR